jgi:predicted short-subunit dehydrogenase-like oxidoreductase (DUF2520 family)
MIDRSPNVFVVGAGPVATMLAGGLRKVGVPVLGLWARRPEAARQAGAVAGVAAFSSAPPDLLMNADVVIVAVRDGAIAEVSSMLIGTGFVNRRHVLLHCAGSMSSTSAFAAVQNAVQGVGVLHPLRAVADAKQSIATLNGAVFGIEGDAAGLQRCRQILSALNAKALDLLGSQMAAYHTAAALASNLVVGLMRSAVQVLVKAGVAEQDALHGLVPLATGAIENIAQSGLVGGLTGPIKRGDVSTVAHHLRLLAEQDQQKIATLYRGLSLQVLELARANGLSDRDATEIGKILQ